MCCNYQIRNYFLYELKCRYMFTQILSVLCLLESDNLVRIESLSSRDVVAWLEARKKRTHHFDIYGDEIDEQVICFHIIASIS